jgi:hypothetical protein
MRGKPGAKRLAGPLPRGLPARSNAPALQHGSNYTYLCHFEKITVSIEYRERLFYNKAAA